MKKNKMQLMHGVVLSLLLGSPLLSWADSPMNIVQSGENQADNALDSFKAPPDDAYLINIYEAVINMPINKGVTMDQAIESMKLKANALNVKFVGMQSLSDAYEAMGLSNVRRTEIYRFCDAVVAKQMLDFDASFLAYMPCRIGIIAGKKGQPDRLVSTNLNVFISASDLPPALAKLANRVRDDLELIMEAGVSGAL